MAKYTFWNETWRLQSHLYAALKLLFVHTCVVFHGSWTFFELRIMSCIFKFCCLDSCLALNVMRRDCCVPPVSLVIELCIYCVYTNVQLSQQLSRMACVQKNSLCEHTCFWNVVFPCLKLSDLSTRLHFTMDFMGIPCSWTCVWHVWLLYYPNQTKSFMCMVLVKSALD